jgi:uncharacterized protein YdcH (DUF465 family)
MPDFLDSVKKGVSSAVSRTSWEAQKQLRVRSKQTEVDKLLEQREKLLNEITNSALELYQKGTLTDPHLTRLCASIQELDHDVQTRETQLLDIKKEPYPAQTLAPAPMQDYAPPSYAPGGASAASAAPSVSSSAPAAAPAAPSVQAAICPNCKKPVRPNALYCRDCGTKLR